MENENHCKADTDTVRHGDGTVGAAEDTYRFTMDFAYMALQFAPPVPLLDLPTPSRGGPTTSHPEKPTNGRLPIGTTVKLKREATIVTGVVEHYEPQWNSTTFPVAYIWHGARIWTLAGTDECTVIPAPDAASRDKTGSPRANN